MRPAGVDADAETLGEIASPLSLSEGHEDLTLATCQGTYFMCAKATYQDLVDADVFTMFDESITQGRGNHPRAGDSEQSLDVAEPANARAHDLIRPPKVPLGVTPLGCTFYCSKEISLANGLGEVVDSARTQCLHGRRDPRTSSHHQKLHR